MPNRPLLTITPNHANPVPTERYVRLLVVLTTFLLFLLTAYLAIRALALIHHTMLLFALGALLAYALDPVVELVRGQAVAPASDVAPPLDVDPSPGMENRKPVRASRQRPRWLGVVTVFATVGLVLGVATFLGGRQAIHQAETLVRDREEIRATGIRKLEQADVWLAGRGVHVSLSDTVKHPPESVKRFEATAAKASLTAVSDVSRALVEGLVVLLITVYLLLFSEEMRGLIAGIFPERVRPYFSHWQDDVNRILGGFVRGQAVLALVLGGAAAIACGLLGLKFWILIGVFVVLASLIPVIGPYIGAIPAILSAVRTPPGLLSPGARIAIVILVFVIINEAGSKILYPKLVGKALGLHELLVLFVLLAGFELGGIVGVLFAAPLTALLSVTLIQAYRFWLGEPPASLANTTAEGGNEAEVAGVP